MFLNFALETVDHSNNDMEWFDRRIGETERLQRETFFGKGYPRKNGAQRGVCSRQLLDLYVNRIPTAITTTTATTPNPCTKHSSALKN